MIRALLNSLLYFPSRTIAETPERAGLGFRELELDTDDGERLHGWWIGARTDPLGQGARSRGNPGVGARRSRPLGRRFARPGRLAGPVAARVAATHEGRERQQGDHGAGGHVSR